MKTKFCVKKNGIDLTPNKRFETYRKAWLAMMKKKKISKKEDIFEIISIAVSNGQDVGCFISYSSKGLNP